MADQSGSAHFQVLFESALQAYEKRTGITLAQHPIAVKLQSCHSIDDITALLQGQAKEFSDFQAKDRITKAIRTTVSILIPLSDATSLADAVGSVRQKSLMVSFSSRTFFFRRYFHLQKQYRLVSPYCLMYVPFYSSYINILVTSK
jgi:hypothetical protein